MSIWFWLKIECDTTRMIHLWCGVALGSGVVAATARRRVLTTRLNVMSQEPPYKMWSTLRRSSVLESESKWPKMALSNQLAS
jgi:hypothetical protein